MARKGTLAPGGKIEPLFPNGNPRCQFVKAPVEGKKYGEQCKNKCVPGRPRCKYHGGKAGAPIKTGAYSKYNPVPRGLAKLFEAAMADPEILNLTKDIALLDAQLWSLAEKAKEQERFTKDEVKQLSGIMRHKKELAAQEMQRRIALGTMIPVEQVLLAFRLIYNSIVRHVPDRGVQARIGKDIRQIVGNAQMEAISEVRKADKK